MQLQITNSSVTLQAANNSKLLLTVSANVCLCYCSLLSLGWTPTKENVTTQYSGKNLVFRATWHEKSTPAIN